MELNISFKHMDTSDFLKTFIEGKSETFKKYFHGRISVTWTLTTEKQNCIAHCHVVGNNMDYFGEGIAEEFKAAIELTVDKIEKQLRKHKEIVKDHLHRG
jgi:putative sigma-54 modulation protein